MLPSTLAAPKNWAWFARLKASARTSKARLSWTNRVRESVASKFSLPGPEKNRRRALPMVPRAGRVSCDASKTDWPARGLVWRERERADQAGVSTPLLLMPLGMLPRSDVSLLLRRVTGNPEVKRAMPETVQSVAMA